MLSNLPRSFSLFLLITLLPASYAHAGVSPQLGVDGTPVRSDVKRPSNKQPCGSGVDIASALDTSTAASADQNGNVNVTVLNFNPGADGSRKVSAKVDPTGTGKKFVKMTVSVNGDPAPKNTGSQQVIAALPAGTKCAGGADKNKCLVQFVTTSGFGNCVVVSQSADAGNTTTAASTSPDAGAATLDVGLDISARAEEDTDVLAKKKKNGNKKKNGKKGGKNSGKGKVAAVKKSGNKADNAKKASGKKKGLSKVQKKKNGKNGKKAEGGKASKDKSKVAAKSSESGKGKKDKKKQKKGGNKKQAGTRAARALLADLE